MNPLVTVMVCFSMLGAADRIAGNRFGLGEEFEKGVLLLGNMALSMIGMIVLSPLLATAIRPVFQFVHDAFGLDPSIIPASLFANDLGGASLASQIAIDEHMGLYNALVVSSMMGCTVSFTIPYSLGVVQPSQQRTLLLGLLCGIVTIPAGCLVAGIFLRLPLRAMLLNLLPLALFSALIALGLMLCPDRCVRIFRVIGTVIKILITTGLALAILKFLTGLEPIPGLASFEEGAAICLNASAVMTGAFPFLRVLSYALGRPLKKAGARMHINEASIIGLISTLASSMATFEMMKDMDSRGVLLNAAFAVSAAFIFADHLAFTMAFDASYISSVVIGKLVSGFLALLVASYFIRRSKAVE